ncbi:hypothetical protein [Actinomadura madurae]|uniref:hypothetical protein n=1 Tax=Actinomadura madurae TaxID=1993 RepID=UPI0020D21F88|nr:hypothetical protein [Actinomadura madurae]MCP9976269.1 hypothetical protein [Actinomadura madurae]MCQ0012242.1 hypothetical protein [Actinomadura madurae]
MIDGAPAGTATRARPKDAPCAPPPGPGRDARAGDAALRGLAEALLIAGVSPGAAGDRAPALRARPVRLGAARRAGARAGGRRPRRRARPAGRAGLAGRRHGRAACCSRRCGRR